MIEGRGQTANHTQESSKFFEKRNFLREKNRRMEDWKPGPGLPYNLGFAKEKGFEPKVKKISKIVQVGRRGEQTSLVHTYHSMGLGAAAGRFFGIFFWKK